MLDKYGYILYTITVVIRKEYGYPTEMHFENQIRSYKPQPSFFLYTVYIAQQEGKQPRMPVPKHGIRGRQIYVSSRTET